MYNLLRKKRISCYSRQQCWCFYWWPLYHAWHRRNSIFPIADKPYYLGIGADVQYLAPAGSTAPVVSAERQYNGSRTCENAGGFGLSGMFTFRLSKRFEIRASLPEFMFAYKNLTYHLKYPDPTKDEKPIMTKRIESILVGLPIHLNCVQIIDNFRVYMFAGGKFEYDLPTLQPVVRKTW